MQTQFMLQQQNLVDESFEHSRLRSVPVINKIQSEAIKFKTLVSNLKLQKKKSNDHIEFYNDSEISNIEHRSERCSFDLQLPLQSPVKKPFSMKASKTNPRVNDQGDSGLKYKPRSTINGRDDIRIRNINQVHKKLIDSLNQKRLEGSTADHQFKAALQHIQSEQPNPQNNSRIKPYTPRQFQNKSLWKKSHTEKLKKYSNEERMSKSFIRNEIPQNINRQASMNPQQFVDNINPKSLIEYLQKQYHSYPTAESIPNQIYSFFMDLCIYFGFKDSFTEPLIKRYQNCIYFGQKVNKQTIASYNGFIWYYRRALYWGQFTNGKKNGYGVQVDIEQTGNQCIWRGTFLNGKKTGYFSLSTPQLQYNGSIKNSYFDGEGHLKTKKSIYQGSFQAGMKHGSGVQTFHNKSLSYRGEFMENKFEGSGQLQGPNYFYKGNFRNGKQHGNGFERTKEFQYVGQFKNGKRNGQGILKMNNGEVIRGSFKDGQLSSEQNQNQFPHVKSNLYEKSIPIQSPSKNLPQIHPSNRILTMESKISLPNTANQKSKRNMVLEKHLSKELHALYEVNQEGTIEQQYEKNENMHHHGVSSDEDDPLQSKVSPYKR